MTSGGGMDGFDWLQTFLPADGQPDFDPNSNNAAYQTHPAFQDAEEVAQAAFLYQQAQNSYSFMRSTNPGASRVSNPSQVYPQVSGEQNRENQHQQASSIHSHHLNSGSPEHPSYKPDSSQQVNQRPHSSVSSQYNPAAQAHQDGYRKLIVQKTQAQMAPIGTSQRPPLSTPSSHGANETQRPTAPVETTNPPTARPPSTSRSPKQARSTSSDLRFHWQSPPHNSKGLARPTVQGPRTHMSATQPPASQNPSHRRSTALPPNSRRLSQGIEVQGPQPTPSVQTTHKPVGGIRTSQSVYQSHSAIPVQPTQEPSRPIAEQRNSSAPPAQGKHTTVVRTQSSWSPYQAHSVPAAQNAQQPFRSTTAQGSRPMSPVEMSHNPRPGNQTWQSAHQKQSEILDQTVQRPHRSHDTPSFHSSVETRAHTSFVPPPGIEISAGRSTHSDRQSVTLATRISETSSSPSQNPTVNHIRSSPTSSGSNQVRVQSVVTSAPCRVNSPATARPASTYSPSASLVPSGHGSIPSHSTPSAQKIVLPDHSGKGEPQEEERAQRNAAFELSTYQAPKQTSQRPPIPQPNEHSSLVASSTSVPTARPCSSSSYATGSKQGSLSASGQNTTGNTQLRAFPLPVTSHYQTERWVPARDQSSDPMPPSKLRRLDNARKQPVTLQNAPSTGSSGSSRPGAQASMELSLPRGPGKSLKNREDLVQPIRQSDALLKESYDPATIARDVLIAAGKHPTEKPLNHHLEALRRNFSRIDSFADLATFRWDLVDVKQEKQEPQVNFVPLVPAHHLPPPPVPNSLHRPPSTPRDPTIQPNHMTSHRVTSRDTPPSRHAPPTPVRIDARAPPGGLSVWGILPFNPPSYHSPQRIPSNLPSGLPRFDVVPPSPKLSPHPSVPIPVPLQPQHRHQSTPKSATPANPPPSPKKVAPKSTSKPKAQAQTTKSQSDSGRSVKSPEARRLQLQVVIPPSPENMSTKRKPGRPPHSSASKIEVAIHREQPVHYQVFSCKWEGCVAELHNIDSTRAHVLKVHIPHSLICKWKDCDNHTPMAAANMFEHMAHDHISKMAWELGDGPTVPVTGET
ncbi:hypothetical protein N7457_005019 [Penicillium paradoxum]|uniref:uncharacterized protein n=1 Tax=Penicillium paradoxum TaxID=176176 RepID=UPI002546C6BC|nr:uncharacterized protein N7457_005019 [Penicillium paradoxum]KAJ5783245.1 hypothetical protein N7457_005019 [Penicillium paradoxum]